MSIGKFSPASMTMVVMSPRPFIATRKMRTSDRMWRWATSRRVLATPLLGRLVLRLAAEVRSLP